MEIVVLGIDLGKNSCSVVGLDGGGKASKRRGQAGSRPAEMPDGDGDLLWSTPPRPHAARQGHQVRLMSLEYVRPYVKAQKNDDRDAEAIAEAATRPTMRFVGLSTVPS